MDRRRLSVWLLIVGLGLLLTWAVAAQEPQHREHGVNATRAPLTIGTTSQIVSLDPAQAYDFASWEILHNTAGALLTYVPGTTNLIPGLAEAMPQISSDGSVYTFTLRSGLQFPDGTPFDANAVKWSIDRVAALQDGASWMVSDFVLEIQVVDSTTVRFDLYQPTAYFPHLLTNPPYYPVSPNCFPANQLAPDSTCGGLGPYTIATWTQGISIELEANPGYYGPPPQTQAVVVRSFDNATVMRQALEAGAIDVAWRSLTPEDYQALKTNPDLSVTEGGKTHIRFLCVNTTTPPFDQALLRQGIAAAIDRPSLAHNVFLDTMAPLYSMVPAGVWSHQDAFLDRYGRRDLAQARTLLAQMGYSETNKLVMDLWYAEVRYGPLEPQFAEALADDIEETGMISVTVHHTSWPNFRANLSTGVMRVFLLGWYPDYLDPDNFTWPFAHSSSSDNIGIFFNNPAMDSLLEAGRATIPVQSPAREAIYADIQQLWVEEAPTVPLFEGMQTAVAQTWVRNIVVSPSQLLPYFTIQDTRVSATIGTEGGSLVSYDGDTTIEVPAGAITDTIVITHSARSAIPPGGSLSSIGHDFDLTAVYSSTDPGTAGLPAQIAPGHTYTVTTHYDDAALGPTIEGTLGLYWWDEGAGVWSQQGITSHVNTIDNLLLARVDHFSRFAVLGETWRAYLPLILRSH